MADSPVLSILIATKNRIPYCQNVIETILDFPDQDFELVVQDNSDSTELKDYAGKISDERFVYNYTPPPFSSIDNFNAVLALAKGEYVCLIGDDDGVNPEIFAITRWAQANNHPSIIHGLNCVYWWPDATKVLPDKKEDNGLLNISGISARVSKHSTAKGLMKLIHNGGQNYLDFNLPKLYHGIVKKEFLNLHKKRYGYYIGGLSPDIYTAVALSEYISYTITIDYPLTISGICIASTSADSATKRNTGKLEDAPHFRDRGPYDWSAKVPKFYSGINIWADSALAALKDVGRYDLIEKFNVLSLSVYLLERHADFSYEILENLQKNSEGRPIPSLARAIKFQLFLIKIKRLIYRILRKTRVILGVNAANQNKPKEFKNVLTIEQAIRLVSEHLKNRPQITKRMKESLEKLSSHSVSK